MKKERYHLSVAVFVLLLNDKHVCMFRRENTGWMDGCYSLPAGGLEKDETIKAAAVREAREEVGVQIKEDDLILGHTMHVKTDERSWIGHFFTCTSWENTPYIAEPDKHGDLLWADLQLLPKKTISYVEQAINNIRLGISYSEHGW